MFHSWLHCTGWWRWFWDSWYQKISISWILLEPRMMEVVATTEAARCAKLQSNHHHQLTNTQLFTGRMPFLTPNQKCQSTEGRKYHIPGLLTPSSPRVLQPCLWPLMASVTLTDGCHACRQPSDASTVFTATLRQRNDAHTYNAVKQRIAQIEVCPPRKQRSVRGEH